MTGSPATSYAAIWAEADGPSCSGSVGLGNEGLEFTGGEGLSTGDAWLVGYGDVVGVEVVRDPGQRLNGYPTLRVERRRAPALRISTIGLGMLSELNELLAAAIAKQQSQPQLVGIVVPLRKRGLAAASALVEHGPPFDLAALGVERHDVLLSEREAIFLFEGPRLDETVQRLVGDPSVWRAASDWARVTAGPPRLAGQRFGWQGGRRIR